MLASRFAIILLKLLKKKDGVGDGNVLMETILVFTDMHFLLIMFLKVVSRKKKKETRSLEQVLEEERSKLDGTGTKVTPETFEIWKEKVKKEKLKKQEKASTIRQEELKSGKKKMTGREYLVKHQDEKDLTEDGEAEVDILSHMKSKNQEEEKIDEENAKIAEMLAKEVEKELQQEKSNSIDQITAPEQKPTDGEEPKIEVETKEAQLAGVDTSLFVGDEGDLGDVEFSDEI